MKRFVPAMLVAASVLAAAALPASVGATETTVDHPLGADLAGAVNLSVADVDTAGVNITAPTTATVNGTVNPNSVGTSYYFEYGPNGNLALRTPTVSLGGTLDPRQVAADLLDLAPGTIYDYRLVAAGPGGLLSVGPTMSFQTASAAASSTKKGKKGACTIRGTKKNDILRGTRKRDVICGLGGRDVIRGLAGNDVIRGGAGNDRVLAGAGRDRVWGNAGNDALFGQAGRDSLYGGKGRDKVVGGKGKDSAKIDRFDRVRSVEKTSR